jgi:hypothetical protein
MSPRRDIGGRPKLAMLELVFMPFLPGDAASTARPALCYSLPVDRVSPAPGVTSIAFFADCPACRPAPIDKAARIDAPRRATSFAAWP